MSQRVCYAMVSHSNNTTYTHMVSTTWLLKHDLNKGINNRRGNVDEKKPKRSQPHRKNSRQLRKAERRRSLLLGRVLNQLSGSKWSALKTYPCLWRWYYTDWAGHIKKCVYVCMHVTIHEKKPQDWKGTSEDVWGGLEEGKGEGKTM